MKSVWRWLWRGALLLALLWAAWVGPDLWPGPFFPYCATQDRLSLCSDLPFDQARGQILLSEAAARLARSPLNDSNEHRIFVSNTAWRVALFMHNSGAAAFSIYPSLSRNVFSHHADIGADIAFHATGEAAQPPRTFIYYMTHEFAHALTGEHVGIVRFVQMPVWVREGYADYVGMGSSGPEDNPGLLYARDRAHDPAFANNLTYYRYRMLVAYFLEDRRWSLNELLTTNLTMDQAQRVLDQVPPVSPLK